MSETQEQDKRVVFERPVDARLMAIDGTWQPCKIHDVAETSAKLVIDGAVTDIGQKEFFLVLSPTGLAHRHCELSWVKRRVRRGAFHQPRESIETGSTW